MGVGGGTGQARALLMASTSSWLWKPSSLHLTLGQNKWVRGLHCELVSLGY